MERRANRPIVGLSNPQIQLDSVPHIESHKEKTLLCSSDLDSMSPLSTDACNLVKSNINLETTRNRVFGITPCNVEEEKTLPPSSHIEPSPQISNAPLHFRSGKHLQQQAMATTEQQHYHNKENRCHKRTGDEAIKLPDPAEIEIQFENDWRKLQKIEDGLNNQQMMLFHRHAEILQLRMKIVKTMMRFESESKHIIKDLCQRRGRHNLHTDSSKEHLIQEQFNASWPLMVTDESPDESSCCNFENRSNEREDRTERFHASWPQMTYRTYNDGLHDRFSYCSSPGGQISFQIHTILEDLSGESSTSSSASIDSEYKKKDRKWIDPSQISKNFIPRVVYGETAPVGGEQQLQENPTNLMLVPPSVENCVYSTTTATATASMEDTNKPPSILSSSGNGHTISTEPENGRLTRRWTASSSTADKPPNGRGKWHVPFQFTHESSPHNIWKNTAASTSGFAGRSDDCTVATKTSTTYSSDEEESDEYVNVILREGDTFD